MTLVKNPVLTGFHPDPSMLRVGEDYYIANSTFEWMGGVEIHHSKNLADWEFVCRPLETLDALDMTGNPASGGIWAPCLSWSDGLFWLIFTDVKSWNRGPFKDSHNYVTTAKDIQGPWSKPVYLNSSGFDPSLFHDDGRKWLVNMEWDYRQPGTNTFSGILLQEFDGKNKKLVGPVTKIFTGTAIGMVEGPHLYKRNGWYYLVTAEGGTEYRHAATVSRSRRVDGPYEVHPHNPLVTSRDKPQLALQKAGHGSLCEGTDGRWFLAFLVGRPLQGRKECVLGRETAIAEVKWENDWPVLLDGSNNPPETFQGVSAVGAPSAREVYLAGPGRVRTYHFNDESFRKDFMTLRRPWDPQLYSLSARKGALRIFGRESPVSAHNQALLCRRQTDFVFTAETWMEFSPKSFQQMAGLIYRYDEANQFYLRASWDEQKKSVSLGIMAFDKGAFSLPMGQNEVVLSDGKIGLKLEVNQAKAQFLWSQEGDNWKKVGPEFDAGILSDDYGTLGFTGAYVGMACCDFEHHLSYADFLNFTYTGKD